MKVLGSAVVVLVMGIVLGCGGAPPPVDLLASTEGAIRGAEEAGAAKDPQGALHLKLAKEEVTEAKALMDDDDNEIAQRKLRRAEADAEVAHAYAEKAATLEEASEAVKDLQKVKKGK